MHAYNRVPSSGQSSPSAPSSPRLRSKPAPRFPAPKTLPQHLASRFLSLLLRRQGIFLFAPLIYISAVLFYINTLDFHSLPPPHYAPPGSVYRSPQLYANLRPQMDSDNSNADAVSFSQFHLFCKKLHFLSKLPIMCKFPSSFFRINWLELEFFPLHLNLISSLFWTISGFSFL